MPAAHTPDTRRYRVRTGGIRQRTNTDGRASGDEGQTVKQATHIFDAVRFLAGDVERVSATGVNRLEDGVDFSDTTSTTMEHENGLVSHVSSSCDSESNKFGIEVVADGATLEVDQYGVSETVDVEEIDEEFERNPYVREVSRSSTPSRPATRVRFGPRTPTRRSRSR